MDRILAFIFVFIVLISKGAGVYEEKWQQMLWPWKGPSISDTNSLEHYLPPWTGTISQDGVICGAALFKTTDNLAIFLTSQSCSRSGSLIGKHVNIGNTDGTGAGQVSLVISKMEQVQCSFPHGRDGFAVFAANIPTESSKYRKYLKVTTIATLAKRPADGCFLCFGGTRVPKQDQSGYTASYGPGDWPVENAWYTRIVKFNSPENCPYSTGYCVSPDPSTVQSGNIPMGTPIATRQGINYKQYIVHGIRSEGNTDYFMSVGYCLDRIKEAAEKVKKQQTITWHTNPTIDLTQ